MNPEDEERLAEVERKVEDAGTAEDKPHGEMAHREAAAVVGEARADASDAVAHARKEAAEAVSEARHEAAAAVSEARHDAAEAVSDARTEAAIAVADAQVQAEGTVERMRKMLVSAKWFIVVALVAFFIVYLLVR